MFKTNLRTIAQVSAIALAIRWGCQSVPASSQDLWPSSFTTIPRTDGDRPILRDRINTPHLDIFDDKKVLARLPQFAETVQLDRVALGQCQVKMPELSARVKDR